MASSPRFSLIERLVQERLRSGSLEASAANLLRLGEAATADTTVPAVSAQVGGIGSGTPGMAALVRPLPPGSSRGAAPDAAHPDEIVPSATLQVLPGAASLQAGFDGVAAPAVRSVGVQSVATDVPPVMPPAPVGLRPLTDPATEDGAVCPPGLTPQESMPASGSAVLPSAGAGAARPLDPGTTAERRQGPLAAPTVFSQAGTMRETERSDLALDNPTVDAVALERGGMVDWSRTRSRISEEFRLVQRQILRAAFGPGAEPGFSNLLMVTSARPGEGKSFTSLNLAGSIARQGDNHVLLMDADSKRDSFCYPLGLAENRGLLDLVANPKLDPSPLIVKTPIDRLSILPVGRERERSAELFSTKEMTRLIQSLGRRYADRLLILDAPPCLSTSDPAVLAPVVGQILFVVEADRTQRDEVEASLDLIQACPNITLVLNKQQISSRYTFGAYSSYYSS